MRALTTTAVIGAEAGDRAHVAAAGAVGHVAEPHVVEHALPQRRDRLGLCHRNLLWTAETRRSRQEADDRLRPEAIQQDVSPGLKSRHSDRFRSWPIRR